MINSLDQLCVNTIRTLAMDAVQAADSGHPGTPMSMAPTAYALWQRHLKYDPADPAWLNRDRFVLSAGHASMLLYALLHLAEVRDVDGSGKVRPSVSLDDIRSFRRLDSRTPGHPEHGLTTGVETTTGPLGQGVATSVGMAIAGRWMASQFNRSGFEIVNYDVYALAGDGCMMEGVSGEAASLAGHLRLSNLCWSYDSNRITIEGHTELAFSDDVAARFTSYGWRVLHVDDANDLDKISAAFSEFQHETHKPCLIIVESRIAFGSPNFEDTPEAHGSPLGEEEVRLTKRGYGWPEDAHFLVPDGVHEHFRAGIGRWGGELRKSWEELFQAYRVAHPEMADMIQRMKSGELPDGWDSELPVFPADAKGNAGRNVSGAVLNSIARNVPWMLGGSADLSPSTKTRMTFPAAGVFSAMTPAGRNIHFGVREHAMAAAMNGMALCGIRPFGSGFLIFSDYARPAIRLAALMDLPVVHVFTHDSIAVGEDGPTHQPVEQLASLRAIPKLVVLRPADANEVVEAWRFIMTLEGRPVALVLSRQNLPTFDRSVYAPAKGVARGAYVLADCAEGPRIILIATGSEVSLCLRVHERLRSEGIGSRVVSMPSWELFEEQSPEYRAQVLPPNVSARLCVEQGATMGWERYAGPEGLCIGMPSFGASGPMAGVQEKFGFTVDAVLNQAKRVLARTVEKRAHGERY